MIYYSPWLLIVIACFSGSCLGLGVAMFAFDYFYPSHRNRKYDRKDEEDLQA